jgi:hypothetical protein
MELSLGSRLIRRATQFGERTHWDLWGPAAVRSVGGKHYAAFRKDDYSRETQVYFLAKKSDTFEASGVIVGVNSRT